MFRWDWIMFFCLGASMREPNQTKSLIFLCCGMVAQIMDVVFNQEDE